MIVKAAVYEGPRKVSVNDVPDARIERPTDVLVRITATNIWAVDCGLPSLVNTGAGAGTGAP